MNRSTGIVYLRPLVCPLSAIVAAILLCGSNHADAHVPPGIGVMYLKIAMEWETRYIIGSMIPHLSQRRQRIQLPQLTR